MKNENYIRGEVWSISIGVSQHEEGSYSVVVAYRFKTKRINNTHSSTQPQRF